MDVTDIIAIVGGITGPLGLLLAFLVYLRDRPRVSVSLQFDMQGYGSLPNIPAGYAVITAHNVGRRSIFLSHPHIRIPKRFGMRVGTSHLLFYNISGKTMSEGGPPFMDYAEQDGFDTYKSIWPQLRASVVDATGRNHYSDWPTMKPDWAADAPDFPIRVRINRIRNWLRRFRL